MSACPIRGPRTRPARAQEARGTAPVRPANPPGAKLALVPPPDDHYVGPRSARAESTPKLPILLFNDQCAVCRRIARWVIGQEAKNGEAAKLEIRPIGSDPEALKAIHPGLDIWDAYKSVHVVMPDGSMRMGGDAVGEVLRRLPATGWLAGALDLEILGFRPFQSLLDAGYYLLDNIRPAFGCESCGHGPPAWAFPITLGVKAYRALFGGGETAAPAQPLAPAAASPKKKTTTWE